jgi:hypothetical protein
VEPIASPRSVFVGIETSSYSGATLLAFLLNAHPQIASIGEMNGVIPSEDPWSYRCSCGKRIRVCEFWQAVTLEMIRCGFEFNIAHFDNAFRLAGPRWMQRLRVASLGSAKLDSFRDLVFQTLPGEQSQINALVARNVAFAEAVLRLTGKSVFVDTSKDHLRARALRMFSPYDVRVIHLVRDPRGVIASRLRRGVSIGVSEAARQWVRLHTRLQNSFASLAPDRYIRVRYESLCRDPCSVLRELYAFCGADPGFRIQDLPSTSHHIVGNAMRLDNLSEIKLDERWRQFLTAGQQKEIWQIAGKLSMQYGYHG